jgi:FlaA1/EpsC-like NDP-sugar epimerase
VSRVADLERSGDERAETENHGAERSRYLRFGAMIATSTVVMFVLTYSNAYAIEHVRWSEERVYMALLMGGAMAIVMLGFMWGMHKNTTVNMGIIVGSLVLFAVSLGLSRSQILVDDVAYMKGMIPHHSIAILTSERAGIDDVRVGELADEIMEAQRREIAEMDWLIQDIEKNGLATTEAQARDRPVPDFQASE